MKIDYGQDFLEGLKNDFWHENKDIILSKFIKGPTVLDAGCGNGSLSIKIAKRGYKVTAIDDYVNYFNIAKKNAKGLNIKFIEGDLIKYNFKEKFDTIILSGVIEHIKDDINLLKKMKNFLKDKGNIIILTSAYPFLYSNFDRSIGHYRRYSKKGLIKIIKKSGLKVKLIKNWNILGIPILIITKLLGNVPVSNKNFDKTFLNKTLNYWFRLFENKMLLHIGLDFIVVAKK